MGHELSGTTSAGPLTDNSRVFGVIAGDGDPTPEMFAPPLIRNYVRTLTDTLYPTQAQLSSLDDYVNAFALLKDQTGVGNGAGQWAGQSLRGHGFADGTYASDLATYGQLQNAVLNNTFSIPNLDAIGTVDPAVDLLLIYDASAGQNKRALPSDLISALDNDLAAIAALASTGFATRTATDTWAQRTLTAPAAGFSITNPAGVAGNPTFVLANDLSAIEGLASTGIAVRSATDTWVQRSLANASAGLTWTNGDGVAGNPTPVFANDLGALEGLGSTGIAVRSTTDTWVQRTITGTANEITATNGDGVSGNPTLSLASIISAGGPIGSATVAPIITYDAKGRLTAVSSATITPAASSITGGATLSKTDDTNVTLTLGGAPTTALLAAASLTLGWTGQLGLTRGGTAASLIASNGGIVYSTASAMAILSGTATANQMLLSGASGAPAWSTVTHPATTTINQLLYSSSANVIAGLATANGGLLNTSSSGVPSVTPTPVLGVAGTTVGSVGFQNATSGTITLAPVTGALGSVTLSLPAATDTLVGKATTDILTNKTLDTSVGKGTWTTSGTWTLPALTLGGTVSGGGQQLNNIIIGTTTPLAGSFTTIAASTSLTITSASATASAVGLNGATNPVWLIDASTASQAAGLKLTGAATGGTVALAAIDSGSNTSLTINAKGSGTIGIGSVSTGAVTITPVTTITGALTLSAVGLVYNGVTLTGTTGTGNMVLSASPTLTGTLTASVGAFSSTLTSAAHTITSASATALTVGLNGATNPALQVDASTASSATGLKVKSAAAAAGLALSVITSGTNENLTIDAAGSGTITLGGTSTGAITLTRATTMSAALTYGGVALANSVTGTGSMVLATSPTLVTPLLGTPTSGTLTNCTGLPVAGGGTGIASATAYAVLCGGTTSTGAFQALASVGGAGNVLTSNGAGALPSFQPVAGTGTVTSITPGGGLTSTLTATAPGSAITGAGTLSGAELVNAQTGTTYAIVDGDRAKLVTASNAAAQAYTIAQAGASSAFQAGWFVDVLNKSTTGIGIVTITPTTSTINGLASLALGPGQSVRLVSDGTNWQTSAVSNTAAFAAEAVAYANLAINGGMAISQEVGTTSTAIVSATDKYITDQWELGFTSAVPAVVVGQQVTSPTPPAGFSFALQMKATTADASLAAGEFFYIHQPIEGNRVDKLAFGGASAQPVTVGFWVYATISGTMTVALRNSAVNRSYVTNVTISSATTWEYKTVTIPGDTSGTWLTTTGIGIDLSFCFGTGSTFQGTNNTWNAANNFGTSSTTNFFATNNNLVAITGVTMLPGSDLPASAMSALAQRHYADELRTCKRYYLTLGDGTVNWPILQSYGPTGSDVSVSLTFPTTMRVAPTMSKAGTWSVNNCAQPRAELITVDGFAMRALVTTVGGFFALPDSADDLFVANARM